MLTRPSLRSLTALTLACGAYLPLGATCAGAQTAPEHASWGLFSARYDTYTSDFIYAVYGYGRSFAMVGTLQNPRSGWTELVGAIGRGFTLGDGPSQSVAAGVARAQDRWYAQVYFVPAVPIGRAWLRATAEFDLPMSHGGTTQFAFSPLSLTVPTVRFLEIGMGMDLDAADRARTTAAVGPEVRVTIPGAVIGADLQRMAEGSTSRFRLFFTTQF